MAASRLLLCKLSVSAMLASRERVEKAVRPPFYAANSNQFLSDQSPMSSLSAETRKCRSLQCTNDTKVLVEIKHSADGKELEVQSCRPHGATLRLALKRPGLELDVLVC